MKKKEETGKHVRMLTHEIRSTLNRHTILKTTLVELADTLKLKACNIWMPSDNGKLFELTHELDGSNMQSAIPLVVPESDPGIQQVRSSSPHYLHIDIRSHLDIWSCQQMNFLRFVNDCSTGINLLYFRNSMTYTLARTGGLKMATNM